MSNKYLSIIDLINIIILKCIKENLRLLQNTRINFYMLNFK